MISIVACYHGAKLCAHAAQVSNRNTMEMKPMVGNETKGPMKNHVGL